MTRLGVTEILVILGFSYMLAYSIEDAYEINKIFSFLIISTTFFIFYFLFIKQFKKINDRTYYYGAWSMGSYANYFAQSEGNRWTPSLVVKRALKKGDLFLDKFRFDRSVKRFFKFFSFRKKFENFNCYIDPKELIKSGIVFGKMGSGKTEFYNSILEQDLFNRYIINDIKGDFTQKFYNKRRDIILNPYDQRGQVWDIFKEAKDSPFIVEIFMTNLFNSLAGDKKDFFSANSKDHYMQIFSEINFKLNKSSKEKMAIFIKELKKYFDSALNSGRTSEADIASTMKITYEFFDYLNFCMQNGAKTFTIREFLNTKNRKLFLLSRDDQKSKLTPFYTGFLAAFSAVILSKPDNEEDLTLFVLDEYLSFAKNLDEETLEGLHIRIRSKGGCLLPGVQFFPSGKDEHLTQKILNSSTFFFLFEGIDLFTLEKINKTVGKVRYKKENIDTAKKRFENTAFHTEEADLSNTAIMQSLAENFEHITFIPSKKILYKGYTPLVKLENKNEQFIQSKFIKDFYRNK